MSTFIFPAGKHSRKTLTARMKPTTIPRQLFHLIRGATDAVEGLELFLSLLEEPQCETTSEAFDTPGYLAFDAHVGDTACQLRACMLLEVINRYRQLQPSSIELLQVQACIDRLKKMIRNAHSFCQDLLKIQWHKLPVEALNNLGVSKHGMTMEEILRKIGWYDSESLPGPQDSECLHTPPDRHTQKNSSPSDRQNCVSNASLETVKSSARLRTESGIFAAVAQNEDHQLGMLEATSSSWKPWDWYQNVNFLVYSYVLSKYKRFVVRAQVYGANIKPELALQVSHDLMDSHLQHPYQLLTRKPIEEEIRVLQSYISDLSCSWLQSVARTFCPHPHLMTRLLETSQRTSVKGVSSVSSYLGYIAIRELWAQTSTPIIVISRRFCPFGFHANVFEAALHVSDYHADITDSVIRPNISWKLRHVSKEELQGLRKSLHPHIVICGNSLDGEHADYLERLPSSFLHKDEECSDNVKHCKEILLSNQDQVVLAIFADHRHYAFELSGEDGERGEEAVIQQIMDGIVPGLSETWRRAKDEARTLGTGPSLRLFMWQHVALESPARILRLLEGLERPWLLGAPILGNKDYKDTR